MELGGSSIWVSKWEINWRLVGDYALVVGVVESTIDSHLEISLIVDLSIGSHLRVVNGDTGELWDRNMSSINCKVLIDSSVNHSFDC